jgi:hypothetical protein
MRTFSLLFGAVLTALGISSASATVRIASDNGGQIGAYVNRYMQVRQTGEQVVIDGTCLSACTMVVGIVPRDRVCVTPNAVLGFHAAWRPDGAGGKVTSGVATQALLKIYPPAIRRWIAQRGGLTPQMKYLQGRELASLFPPCGGSGNVAAQRVRTRSVSRPVLRSVLGRGNIDARQW